MAQPAVHGVFRALSQPVICTLLYAGTLYAWHYLMHVTMLASGLLFFWRVFDPRPAPWGTPFHQRLVMLGAAIFANIPLGAV